MSARSDMAHCAEATRHGSRSFHAAGQLLPARVRGPALALYAFCRVADDAVDHGAAKRDAVRRLHDRLERIYAGRPRNAPADRAFAAVIDDAAMPRALPEALLEGLTWDAEGRRYATLEELRAYSARVAASVGAMMCILMRVRDPHALARACDLGVAMQLTNIARDVGSDARAGRLYLPTDWLEEAGLAPDSLIGDPAPSPALSTVIGRVLGAADALYARADAGVGALPADCRPGIFAARHIYAGIGGALRRQHLDPVSARARTNAVQKLGWLMLSAARAGVTMATPRSPIIYARSLPETAFLVEAAAGPVSSAPDWSDALCGALAGLKSRDAERVAAAAPRAAP